MTSDFNASVLPACDSERTLDAEAGNREHRPTRSKPRESASRVSQAMLRTPRPARVAAGRGGDGAPRFRAPEGQVAGHCPNELITYRVSVLARTLSRLVNASVCRDLRLTSTQWRVLVGLNRLGTSASGELARMSNLNHSQVSRAAFELSRKGLITQVGDPADRRKKNLALTPEATERMRDAVPLSLEREARLQSRLHGADYATFIRALEALEDEAQVMLMEFCAAK